ncbi:MAG TPA: branched-chain amino acid ABC transporter permease [Gaiellaceae bacterium]|nr:branched-chain amino acid ABC transporter permease [Gaiellaceae bacterium]
MAIRSAERPGVRQRLGSAARAARLDDVRAGWRRLPDLARSLIPAAAVLALVATYPLYVETLNDGWLFFPSEIPIIQELPSVSTAVIMIVFVMMAVGLNIVVGYSGLLDLGYVAFYAVGAYTAGWLASGHFQQVKIHLGSVGISAEARGIHLSLWLVLLLAGILTAVAGVLIGLPTLRLRGDYLAIVTLGFGEIIPQFVRNADNLGGFNLTAGTFGINPIDSPGFGEGLNQSVGLPVSFQQSFDKQNLFFWTALALFLITVFSSVRLRDSRLGRAWIAIREDETAAAAMGVPLMRTKTWAYAIGAFFGGVAGAFYASFKSGAFPSEFYFNISVFLLCMVILGGMGSVWGVVVAGAILAYLNQEGLSNIGGWLNRETPLDFEVAKYQFGIYGAIIVLMMLFRPIGLIPEKRRKQELEEGVHQGDTVYGERHA